MALNSYFTLTITGPITRRFRAIWHESYKGGKRNKRMEEEAVDGTTLLTQAAGTQRVHALVLLFTSGDTSPDGTYADLLTYWAAGTAQFQDWDTSISPYNVIFPQESIEPAPLEPFQYYSHVPFLIVEKL